MQIPKCAAQEVAECAPGAQGGLLPHVVCGLGLLCFGQMFEIEGLAFRVPGIARTMLGNYPLCVRVVC